MTPRPTTLAISLATLAVVAVLALGVRLGMQAGALSAAKGDLADASRAAVELQRTVAEGLGPPLFDAGAGPAAEGALAARLRGLGLEVQKTQLVAATPAGRNLALGRFVVAGRADPAALDRLSLWADANQRSAILEQLTASAAADGKSDVRVELDAIVRGLKGSAP
ncbi:MAG TPA: hypothetical protein VGF50_13080 [Caulobacteraceae bacterium]|jgi:hypothetical protein